jgi:4-amino-4-deoxy-L-arabinose transferase-like glycosyltransferase
MNSKFGWRPIGLLLLARLLVGLTYSFLTPPWESYDETGHFQYIRYLAKHQTFTLQPGDPEAEVIWSKFQPPLYYAVLAPALSGFDFGPTFIYPERNPFFVNGNAGLNYALHPPQPSSLEATQITALYIARALGVLITTVSVLAMLAAAHELWPSQPKLVWTATLLYAFWPQLLFVGSMATNDLFVTSLATIQVYLAVLALKRGLSRWQLLGFGLILLAALLTKLNGLALLPLTLLALFLSPAYSARLKWGFIGLGFGLAALGVVGLASLQFVTEQIFQLETFWRFWRNLQAGAIPAPPGTAWWGYGLRTFVASYGWGNVETFSWVYWFWSAFAGLALIGLAKKALATKLQPVSMWLALATLPLSIVGLSFALAVAQQDPFLLVGRYWLPALSVVVLALVIGWASLLSRWPQFQAWQAINVLVIAIGWLTPFAVIAPVYAYPKLLTSEETTKLQPLVRFGNVIELLNIQSPTPTHPNELAITQLCWRALQPITEKFSLRLEILGPDGQGYGRINLLPGNGSYPPHFWESNAAFCESYSIPVQNNFPAPAVGHISIQWINLETERPIQTQLLSSENLEAVQTPLVVRSASPALASTPPANPLEFMLGENLQLSGYSIQQLEGAGGWRITLNWEALGPIGEDAVIFIHLRTATSPPYSQSDGRPRNNTYPTTAWATREQVIDEHILRLPDGPVPEDLQLFIGAYYAEDPTTRLPIFDRDGQRIQNDEIPITPP